MAVLDVARGHVINCKLEDNLVCVGAPFVYLLFLPSKDIKWSLVWETAHGIGKNFYCFTAWGPIVFIFTNNFLIFCFVPQISWMIVDQLEKLLVDFCCWYVEVHKSTWPKRSKNYVVFLHLFWFLVKFKDFLLISTWHFIKQLT